MTPEKMTHLAINDEGEFMRLVRESQIKNLLNYKGFDATREKFIILDSGRQINSTAHWNPLTYALVFDRREMINFIMKENAYFLDRMMSIDEEIDMQVKVSNANQDRSVISQSFRFSRHAQREDEHLPLNKRGDFLVHPNEEDPGLTYSRKHLEGQLRTLILVAE